MSARVSSSSCERSIRGARSPRRAAMRVEDGAGLEEIVAEERADAEAYEQDRERIDSLEDNFLRTALIVRRARGRAGSARDHRRLLVDGAGASHRLRPRVRAGASDRHRARARSHAAPPGRGGRFVRVHGDAVRPHSPRAITRRSRRPRSERSGAACARSTSSDLELSAGEPQELTRYEDDVAGVVDAVLDGGSERLSRFRDRIEDERESMSERFESFKGAVGTEGGRRKWFRSTGAIPLVLAGVVFVGVGSPPGLPRTGRLALRLSALLRRRAGRRRDRAASSMRLSSVRP